MRVFPKDVSKTDGACCENCLFATKTEIDGLIDCSVDGHSKDDDMVCEHWQRQE